MSGTLMGMTACSCPGFMLLLALDGGEVNPGCGKNYANPEKR